MLRQEMPPQDERQQLKNKLEKAEQARLSGAPTYTPEESRKRLEAIITADNQYISEDVFPNGKDF